MIERDKLIRIGVTATALVVLGLIAIAVAAIPGGGDAYTDSDPDTWSTTHREPYSDIISDTMPGSGDTTVTETGAVVEDDDTQDTSEQDSDPAESDLTAAATDAVTDPVIEPSGGSVTGLDSLGRDEAPETTEPETSLVIVTEEPETIAPSPETAPSDAQ